MAKFEMNTVGEAGLRYDGQRLIIGQNPVIVMHNDREQELPNGDFVGVGPARPILDMQPTVILFDDLIAELTKQNARGFATDFLGHVRVMPS